MGTLVAAVGGGAAARLDEIGMLLAPAASALLFVGALFFYLACRSPARLLLVAGMFLFAAGVALRSVEQSTTLGRLGVAQLSYYPGWRTDLEEIFLAEDPGLEFSDDDVAFEFPDPAWWEAAWWWGQRLGLLLGAGLAAGGSLVEARTTPGKARRTKQAARKRA